MRLLIFLACSGMFLSSTAAFAQSCTHTPLWYRISHLEFETAKRCLEEGWSADATNLGTTMLSTAISTQSPEMVELLLSFGADPNLTNSDSRSPLMIATEMGNLEILGKLLDRGADVNAVDQQNRTAMIIAASAGNTEAVHLLAQAGANLETQWYYSANQNGGPLHVAAAGNHIETVDALLSYGADVNALTPACQTPIFWAALSGFEEVAQSLLDAGAVINIIGWTSSGWKYTAVSAAEESGNASVHSMILEKGHVIAESPSPECQIQEMQPSHPVVTQEEPDFIIGFLQDAGDGVVSSDALAFDHPTYIVLDFDEPQDEPQRTVTINTEYSTLELQVVQITPTQYRSELPFMVRKQVAVDP